MCTLEPLTEDVTASSGGQSSRNLVGTLLREHKRSPGISVSISFLGLAYQSITNWALKTTDTYYFAVLESGSLKPGCWQDWSPLEALREHSVPIYLPASCGCWQFLVLFGLEIHYPNVCLHGHIALSPMLFLLVSMFFLL